MRATLFLGIIAAALILYVEGDPPANSTVDLSHHFPNQFTPEPKNYPAHHHAHSSTDYVEIRRRIIQVEDDNVQLRRRVQELERRLDVALSQVNSQSTSASQAITLHRFLLSFTAPICIADNIL